LCIEDMMNHINKVMELDAPCFFSMTHKEIVELYMRVCKEHKEDLVPNNNLTHDVFTNFMYGQSKYIPTLKTVVNIFAEEYIKVCKCSTKVLLPKLKPSLSIS